MSVSTHQTLKPPLLRIKKPREFTRLTQELGIKKELNIFTIKMSQKLGIGNVWILFIPVEKLIYLWLNMWDLLS